MSTPVDEFDLDIRLGEPSLLDEQDIVAISAITIGECTTGCKTCGRTCPTELNC